ncbi:MAG: hypothetical protein LBR70_02760 [Lactobacillaceae bacterium]|jgi:phosphoenolpyruvate-protein kinase (PTS system EI component)|nr:hypothetical protein [Lactobacillaceae bacterium]
MKYLIGLQAEPLTDKVNDKFTGVGMIRSEYLCRSIEEYFPLQSCRDFIYEYVDNICRVFADGEVWYRTAELIAPEINVLKGADHVFEEKHYLLGLRGVRRGLKYQETFMLELDNIAKLSTIRPNLNVLFPYIKDAAELEKCLEMLRKVNFANKYGIMAEIPSAIITLEDFLALGVSNVTVGVNDLTSLTLGTYRESGYHDCTHPAVIKLIETVIDKVRTYGQKGAVVNVAGTVNKKLCDICKKLGADNFIINYPLIPGILGTDPAALPYINQLKEIKALTKKRRLEAENAELK